MTDTLITLPQIKNKILTIRGQQVMLDRDLAEFYGVKTKRLNEAVKRNKERFPKDFCFQLTKEEYEFLRSQTVTSNSKLNFLRSQFATSNIATSKTTFKKDARGGRRYLPYVFSEPGVAMLASVLKTPITVKMSIQIIRAFTLMRHFLKDNAYLFEKLYQLEKRQLITDKKLEVLLTALESNKLKFKAGIFYDGQVFDAYVLLTKLIKQAKKSIILIDNYINSDTLILLTKRKENVTCTIYTEKITDKLKLALKKHNAQYSPVTIKTFTKSHDRFLILDNKTIYHIGASLKDAGKKWFAVTKLNIEVENMIKRLND